MASAHSDDKQNFLRSECIIEHLSRGIEKLIRQESKITDYRGFSRCTLTYKLSEGGIPETNVFNKPLFLREDIHQKIISYVQDELQKIERILNRQLWPHRRVALINYTDDYTNQLEIAHWFNLYIFDDPVFDDPISDDLRMAQIITEKNLEVKKFRHWRNDRKFVQTRSFSHTPKRATYRYFQPRK